MISMKLMIPSDPVSIGVKQITQSAKLTKTINCNGHKFMMKMSMFYCCLLRARQCLIWTLLSWDSVPRIFLGGGGYFAFPELGLNADFELNEKLHPTVN